MSNLHFCNNEDPDPNDSLFKIRHVIEVCHQNFSHVYTPSQDICIDESLLKSRSRLVFKQFNPNKRARFGIKFYKLCQSTGLATGYVRSFKIYTGQDNEAGNLPAGTKVVMKLMELLLGQGYNVFLDNWYTSPDLFVRLPKEKINAYGTVRLYHKNIPRDIGTEKRNKGDISVRSSAQNIMALIWKDKKDVKMLSTMHNSEIIKTDKKDKNGNPIFKPKCVLDYNKGMGGVDRSDQVSATYRSTRKYVKWYKKAFFYILDMSSKNAFALHKILGGTKSFYEFKLSLVEEIIMESNLPAYSSRGCPHSGPTPLRLQGRHFPERSPPIVQNRKPQKRCAVCYEKGNRRETIYQCDQCHIPLYVDPCFKAFHTKVNY